MTVSNRAKSAYEVFEVATLVAHFTFDTGLFLTDSGPNSLQATTQSTSATSSGRFSQAITFTGTSSSYYQIGGLTALGTSNQAFSISIWLRPISLSGVVVFVSNTANPTTWCMPFIGFDSNGFVLAQIFDGIFVNTVSDSTHTVAISVWSHIVQTYSSTNGVRLYINGTLVASQPYTTYGASGQQNYITLGTNLGASGCVHGSIVDSSYQGDMDDFRIYSRELSSTDVSTLYIN